MPDSHHHRRAVERHRHRRHGSCAPAQRHRNQRPRRRSRRRRGCAAARQNRHDHPRQPRCHGTAARAPCAGGTPGRRRPAGLTRGRNARGTFDCRAGEAEIQSARTRDGHTTCLICPLQRPNPHERRGFPRRGRPRCPLHPQGRCRRRAQTCGRLRRRLPPRRGPGRGYGVACWRHAAGGKRRLRRARRGTAQGRRQGGASANASPISARWESARS